MKATAVNKSKKPGHQTRLYRNEVCLKWIPDILESDCKAQEHELMIDSGCFGRDCPPWFAPQFAMVSSTKSGLRTRDDEQR